MATSADARQRNPRGEGGRLRELLLEATVAVIDEVGDVSKVSVRAIAARAGVSPTALYLHFSDRDQLVDAAIDSGFAAFNEALLTAGAPGPAPLDRLRTMGLAYLDFAERQPALYSVLFSSRRPLKGRLTAAESEVDRAAAFAGLVGLVGAALRNDDVAEATDVAVFIWSALHGFATLRTSGAATPWPTSDAFVERTLVALMATA